ncbi:MAG: hypothetical protein J6Q82_04920 [Clostridia bacterium]|nr:hypothetical protein [Clostridia bacterium]
MEDYLRGYDFHRKLIDMDEYERSYFYEVKKGVQGEMEIPLARMKLFEIRHFVMGMENSNEKLLLYYHYVKGDSIEQCAELIGISRATAFRMKKRALSLAVLHKRKMKDEL